LAAEIAAAVADIKQLHVYDFDNTCMSCQSGSFYSISDVHYAVFSSPLPNPQLWAGPTLGYLQTFECFANGGWWHDPGILSATGDGLEKEEAKAWKGWWNEAIVDKTPRN
jgi:HAD domain family 1 in Swiss Army Knife RNA repair proteins